MAREVTELNPEDFAFVQNALRSLMTALSTRKAVGGVSTSIPDEDIVLQSLAHPERGDVLVSAVREGHGPLQVFISNRRDADNPFAVMSPSMVRDFPGRRPLNNRLNLKDGEHSLYLITVQDRDLLRTRRNDVVEGFSAHFQLHNNPTFTPKQADELKLKPLAQCTVEEKWQIYKKGYPGDNRPEQIEHELLSFPVSFARYTQAQKSEMIVLPPQRYKERVGQLIRDIYPGNVRGMLRRDYPAEHQQLLNAVKTVLTALASTISGKVFPQNPTDLNRHLDEVADFMRDIVQSDPELSHFT